MKTSEETPETGGAPRAPDKRRRKELAVQAMRKRPPQEQNPQSPPSHVGKEVEVQPIKKAELEEELRKAKTLQEAKELFDTFGSGVMDEREFHTLLREKQKARQEAVEYLMPGEEETLPVEVIEKPSGAGEKVEITPAPTKLESTPTSAPAPKFNTYEDLEEAFGLGQIKLKEFLQEKKLFPKSALPQTETVAPAGEPAETLPQQGGADFYSLLKEYVAGQERQRQVQAEEEKLQERKRRRPKKHPIRRPDETEGSYKSSRPEFPPTEEMLQITQEMKAVADQAKVKWERITAYKQLNARTFKMIQGLEEDFRQIELLRNKFLVEEARGRKHAEEKAAESRGAIRGPASKPFVQSPGFIKPTALGEKYGLSATQITPDTAPAVLNRLRKLQEGQRSQGKQNKHKREVARKQKATSPLESKHGVRLGLRERDIITEYLDKVGEAFGRGDTKLDKFSAKRDLAKRLLTSPNVPEELATAFGQGTLDLNEYNELKSKFTQKTPRH